LKRRGGGGKEGCGSFLRVRIRRREKRNGGGGAGGGFHEEEGKRGGEKRNRIAGISGIDCAAGRAGGGKEALGGGILRREGERGEGSLLLVGALNWPNRRGEK